jgi:hypothetical protein
MIRFSHFLFVISTSSIKISPSSYPDVFKEKQMKRLFVLLAVLMFVASTASAATKAKKAKKVVKPVVVEEGVPGHFFVQAQGGPGFILSDTGIFAEEDAPMALVSPGWGWNAEAGYAISNVISLSLLYGYEMAAISLDDPPEGFGMCLASNPLLLVAKFTVPAENVRFYGFLGIGVAFNKFSTNISVEDTPVDGVTLNQQITYDQIGFEMAPGVGVEFKLCDQMNLFVQTKLVMNFIGDDLADMAEGPEHKFTSPLMYLPLQVGVNVSFL